MAGPGARRSTTELIDQADITALKETMLDSGLSVAQLVPTAWASASTFRGTDKRGGANGARIRLAPQKDWAVNEPAELASVLQTLEQIQQDFNVAQSGGKRISLADLIVLGGCAAVEKAARDAGHDDHRAVHARAHRRLAGADRRRGVRGARAGGRRLPQLPRPGEKLPRGDMLLDRAYLLGLTAPEMTVLVGGLRALDANTGGTRHGVFTDRPGTLTNDFFVNLLDTGTEWKTSAAEENVYEGRDRATGEVRWTATAVDLVFGAHSQLRAHLRGLRQRPTAQEKFVRDFVAAWDKVMNARPVRPAPDRSTPSGAVTGARGTSSPRRRSTPRSTP